MTDEDGEPLAGIMVSALSPWGTSGQSSRAAPPSTTNDLGEYRLHSLPPGPYYLKAKPLGRWGSGEDASTAYVAHYFPDSFDQVGARLITVRAGEKLEGLDFTFRPKAVFSISGRVLDGRTGQGSTHGMVMAVRAGDPIGESAGGSGLDQTGGFHIPDLLSGKYILHPYLDQGRGESQLRGSTPIEINDSHLENVEATIHPGGTLEGRLSMTSEAGAAPGPLLERVVISLRAKLAEWQPFGSSGAQGVVENGAIRLQNVYPGAYFVSLSLPPSLYLRQVRFNDQEVENHIIHIPDGSTSGKLDLIVSTGAATVSGIAMDSKGRPIVSGEVLLLPDAVDAQAVESAHLRTATTDQRGAFELRGLAPGAYRIAATEQPPPGFVVRDEELLRRIWKEAGKVDLEQGRNKDVTLRAVVIQTP